MSQSIDSRYSLIQQRSRAADGSWWYGVTTTGVLCRPSCPSSAPRPDHVEFFSSPESALRSGFRPCRRCAPLGDFDATLYEAEIDTPLGPFVAVGNAWGLVLLEFTDRVALSQQYTRVQQYFRANVTAGAFPILREVRRELDEYFRGQLRQFTIPIMPIGTPFQRAVWQRLAGIGYGRTTTYESIARAIGRPAAVRAVGGANGDNRYTIVLPCHRVIGRDGTLTGYGGGLWRKRALLELEGALTADSDR